MAIIEGHECKKNNDGPAAKFQDETYGKGRRVANQGGGKAATGAYRCTVCGEEITAPRIVSGGADPIAKKKKKEEPKPEEAKEEKKEPDKKESKPDRKKK